MGKFFAIESTYPTTRVSGVSADGEMVVGTVRIQQPVSSNAFLWTEEEGLGILLGDTIPPRERPFSFATAASADGSVVVGGGAVPNHAFRWTLETGAQRLSGSVEARVGTSSAHGVSADGATVVGTALFVDRGHDAFRWTQESGYQDLGFAGTAYGISADAHTIVGATSNGQAFRWTEAGGRQDLGNGTATAISADGTTIVGVINTSLGPEAFRWTAQGGMQGLGDLPGGDFSSTATAVSADGRIIVGSSSSAVGGEAFVWDIEHGMRGLQQLLSDDFHLGAELQDWRLTSAVGVSANGQTIVGNGLVSGLSWPFNEKGWLVHLDQTNTAPEALDDRAETKEDRATVLDVLANDRDADGGSLTVTAIPTPPQHGAAVINADGTITFTPAPDYVGEDAFTYRVGDGRGGSDEASVVVTVGAMPETASLVLQPRSGTFVYSEDDPAYSASFTVASREAVSELGASIPISFGGSDGSADAAPYVAFNKGLGVAGAGDSCAQRSQIEGAETLRLTIDAGERGFDEAFGTLFGVDDAGLVLTRVRAKGHEPAAISVQAFRKGQLVDEDTFVFEDKIRDHVLPFASIDTEGHPAAFDTLVLIAGNDVTAFSFRGILFDLDASPEALLA